MDIQQSGNVVLVVADSNFINLCKEPREYINRLKIKLTERSGNGLMLFTVSGKYGLGHLDESLGVIQVDDKNKTVFGQTLENATMMFDDLIAITMAASDPYLAIACEVVTNASKPYTRYGYPRK